MAAEQSINVAITSYNGAPKSQNWGINIDNISFAYAITGGTEIWVERPNKRDNDIFTTESSLADLLALANGSGYVTNGLAIYTVTGIKRGSQKDFGAGVSYLINRKKINNIVSVSGGSNFEMQVEFAKEPWRFTVTNVIPASNGGDITVDALTATSILGSTAAAGVVYQHGITTGITAFAGGGQTDAVILVSEYSSVDTVATAADSVKLPALTGTLPLTGRRFVIRNTSANSLAVFPPVGGNLGAGVDTVVALAAGARIEYVSTGALTYISFLG